MRTGAEYVKAGGSLKGMECCGEEKRDGVERDVGTQSPEIWAVFEGNVLLL